MYVKTKKFREKLFDPMCKDDDDDVQELRFIDTLNFVMPLNLKLRKQPFSLLHFLSNVYKVTLSVD